ncbi:hypothetical protein DSM112329_00811 [Paraconexibacter sp. AEG42_29]|uniref:asparagine synthase (glutamine-hydrolyzing) n=1 Tax=Paraconexibacter sp. AEG42_29 TaxID=2997339 RepID=A0AAU7AQY0_9ACTN
MFAGVVSLGRPAADLADPGALRAALAPYHQPDAVDEWRSDRVVLVQHRRDADSGPQPQAGTVLAFWGRIDNRADLTRALDTTPFATDRALVEAGLRREGPDFLTRLVGDFACAAVDSGSGAVTLVRDQVGVKPLCYRAVDGGFAFATSVAALRTLRGPSPTPDPEWIACRLLGLYLDDPQRTPYREIRRVAPGTLVAWAPDTGVRTRRWHTWRDDSTWAPVREDRWVKDYRTVLDEAVRCRIPADDVIGVENSGGLDSTSILALLGGFVDRPRQQIETFGVVHAEHEPMAILSASAAAGASWNHLLTAGAGLASEESATARALRVLGHPEDHGMAGSFATFYELAAARGVRTLFSGFGGDEATTYHGSLLLTELADRGDVSGLYRNVIGNVATKPARTLKQLVWRRIVRRRHHAALHSAFKECWPWHVLRDDVVAEYDLRRRYFDAARYDAPFRTINGFLVDHLLEQTWIAARVSECTLVAGTWGIEYQWPLWDSRLVQQYLSTPSIEKYGPGSGRDLHRRAVRGTVPDVIVDRCDKGMGANLVRPHAGAPAAASPSVGTLPGPLADIVDRRRVDDSLRRARTGAPIGATSWIGTLEAQTAWLTAS